jgi:hypothetical protein
MSVRLLDATHKMQKHKKEIQTQMFYTRYGKMVEWYRDTGARDHSTFS